MIKKLLLIALLVLGLSINSYADSGFGDNKLNIESVDAAVSTYPYKLIFPTGSLTDNGDESTTVVFSTTETDPLAVLATGTRTGATSQAQTFTNGVIMGDASSIGLGAGKGLIQFDDETTDFISLMNGNVGIGTTNPRQKLEVFGSSPGITFGQSGSNAFDITNVGGTNLGFGLIGNPTMMTIQSGGNVGIGTTSPSARLTIKEGTATAGTSPLKFTVAGAVLLTTPESGSLEVDSSGNLYFTP